MAWLDRLSPVEGWITVVLHLAIVLVAARTIEREDWADGLTILTPVAGLAMVNGLVLAKSRVPDLAAHVLAFLLGLTLAVALTAATLDEGLGWRERLAFLQERSELWFRRVEAGRRVDDADLFVLMMAFTVWLVAYSSSWMLYRRRWLLASLALPGMVIVINQGYAAESSSVPMLFYTFGALVLAARHFAFRRQLEWARTRMPAPERLPWHFVRGGLSVALAVILLGWTVPPNAARPLITRVGEQLEGPFEELEERWQDLVTPFNGSSPRGGSFATFGDSFRLGGELNLSDEPVALVHADEPVYLAAHRYNRYDGHGWSTDVEDTFRSVGDEGEIRAPLITFQPGSGVFLSEDMTGDRTRQIAEVTILRPKGDLLLTINTYLSSSELASVQVSWRQLREERFDVQNSQLSEQPEDLRHLISLLRRAQFEPDSATGEAEITDPELQAKILAQQAELRDRYLETSWSIGPEGRVESLFVTGQLPIYDDVEAVRADESPDEGEQYRVTGLNSFASPEDLRSAGTEDPPYVVARYTPLPTTVSERTAQLTREETVGAGNRYDQALMIQDYLRANFTYDEKVGVPPDDQDVVDYFLFESQRGYCEYYASAMVVMLRSLDIPARVAAGYRAVSFDDQAGGYLYREKQAHTWVEVYIPEYGWIPFEPTPAAEPFQHGDETQPEEEEIPTATAEPEPTPIAVPTPTPEPSATPAPVAGGAETRRSQDEGITRYSDELVKVLVVVLVVASVGAGLGAALWLWAFRGLSPIAALYARVQRIGRWWGIRPDPSLTPVEYARELGQVAPSMQTPARYLAQLYEVEQYGGRPVTEADAVAGQSAWKALRGAVLRSWRRRRAKGGKRDR